MVNKQFIVAHREILDEVVTRLSTKLLAERHASNRRLVKSAPLVERSRCQERKDV